MAQQIPTHVVLRRFLGPEGRELEPGDFVRAEGDGWKNTRSLVNSRYLRQVAPADLESVGTQVPASAAGAETSLEAPGPRRGRGRAKEATA
jgi:hypothetical protein